MIKSIFAKILAALAKRILRNYKPKIVGVSGSIGKSSTKQAALAVLSAKFSTRTNIKSYNNEWGVPLTIIGAESPKRNAFGWIALFARALQLAVSHQRYPEVLVLELGIDHPGEIDALIDIARPEVVILTTIGVSHLELFGSEDVVFTEESKSVRTLPPDGRAVLNIDDLKIKSLLPSLHSPAVTYGFDASAQVRIADYHSSYIKGKYGTVFHVEYKGAVREIFLHDVIGAPHVYACAGGIAAGLALGIDFTVACGALTEYRAEPGRMRIIEAVKDAVIIDDSYNAAPLSMRAALRELAAFPAHRKIAALGDMNELGKISEEAHRALAAEIIASGAEYFVGVGPQTKLTMDQLRQLGYRPEDMFWFERSEAAAPAIRDLLEPGTVLLAKGSQNGIRMEKIVKALMADPRRAAELLCRQDASWLG